MILLDTHALVWWVAEDNGLLSAKAREAIEQAQRSEAVAVSAISVWELALLTSRDALRLALDLRSWVEELRSVRRVTFIPVDPEIAIDSVTLPGTFHADPADRIIVATARRTGRLLVTVDRKIRAYPHVRTVW